MRGRYGTCRIAFGVCVGSRGAQEPPPHTPPRMSAASQGRGRALEGGDAQRSQRPPGLALATRGWYDTYRIAFGVRVGSRVRESRAGLMPAEARPRGNARWGAVAAGSSLTSGWQWAVSMIGPSICRRTRRGAGGAGTEEAPQMRSGAKRHRAGATAAGFDELHSRIVLVLICCAVPVHLLMHWPVYSHVPLRVNGGLAAAMHARGGRGWAGLAPTHGRMSLRLLPPAARARRLRAEEAHWWEGTARRKPALAAQHDSGVHHRRHGRG